MGELHYGVVVQSAATPHLGGNIVYGDSYTFYPTVLRYVVERFAVRSSLDVGAGLGHTAAFLHRLGVISIGMDGLLENVWQGVYPLVHHDLVNGPFRAPVDLVVSIECVEHVAETHIENLMETLCQGNLVLITHATPGQGGHHHVNEQPAEYWVAKFAEKGFHLNATETQLIRDLAAKEVCGPGNYFCRSGMLFQRY